MSKRMLIDATHAEETRVAVVEGNRLTEYDYESKVRKQLKGSIFLAKVTRVEPSLQAAFVNFGGNRHGFLPFSEIHPDYFRIPVADREALLAEQKAMLEQLAAEEEAAIAEEEAALAAQERGEQPADAAEHEEDHRQPVEEVGGQDIAPQSGQSQEADGSFTPEDLEPLESIDTPMDETDDEDSEDEPGEDESDDEDEMGDEDFEGEQPDASSEDAGAEDEGHDEDSEEGQLSGDLQNSDLNLDQDVAQDSGFESTEPNLDENSEDSATEENEAPQMVRSWTYRLVTGFNSETSEIETGDEGDAYGFDLEAADNLKSILSQNENIVRLRDEKRTVETEGEDASEKIILWVAFRDDNAEVIAQENEQRGRFGRNGRGRGRFRGRNRNGGKPRFEGNNPEKTVEGEKSGSERSGRFDKNRGRNFKSGGRNGHGSGGRNNFRNKRVELVGGDGVEGDQPFRFNLRKNYKIQEVIKRGQIMLVQVQKEERGNKGAAVTTYLSLPGRYCVLMPNSPRGGGVSRKVASFAERKRMREILKELEVPEGMSVILRTAGVARTKVEIKRDLDYLMRLWDNVRELTLQSSAPANIYEESNLVKRSVRDIYSSEIEEIWVAGDAGFKEAKNFMKMLMPSHIKRVQEYTDEKIPLFHRYQVENQIAEMGDPVVTLKSGGYLVINPTEALISVDVNSGRATKERHIEETALKTNLEAAEEVARQLRLRDLGGLVVIDFIDMEDYRNNVKVERKLKEALSTDRARIQVGRISSFGLLELSRQRLNPSLTEAQFEKCPHCKGVGIIRTVDAAAILALRGLEEHGIKNRSEQVSLSLPNEVAIYILNHKRDMLANIERRYEFQVMIRVDEALAPAGFAVDTIKAAVAVARGAHTESNYEENSDIEDSHDDLPETGNEAIEEIDDETEDKLKNGNHSNGQSNGRDANDRNGDRNNKRRGNRGGRGKPRRNGNFEEGGEQQQPRQDNRNRPERVETSAAPANEHAAENILPQPVEAKPDKFRAKRFSSRKADAAQGDAVASNDSGAATQTPVIEPSNDQVNDPSNDPANDQANEQISGSKKKGWWNKLVE